MVHCVEGAFIHEPSSRLARARVVESVLAPKGDDSDG